jgi:tripartite-type tricarboxylate transporter receptor subunit TctC
VPKSFTAAAFVPSAGIGVHRHVVRQYAQRALTQGAFMKLSHRRQFLHLAAGAAALPGSWRFAQAQAYPAGPLVLFVPFAEGGFSYTFAATFARQMEAQLGQRVAVLNADLGRNGSPNVALAAAAGPSGYFISFGHWGTHVVNGTAYDVHYEFEPVALLGSQPMLIASNNNVPARNLNQLLAWMRTKGSEVRIGTAIGGSTSDVGGRYFAHIAGSGAQVIRHDGFARAVAALSTGSVDLIVEQAAALLPLVREGKFRGYAVTATSRLPSSSGIPAVTEGGGPHVLVSVWYGLWVPKGTPRAIVAKLNSAAVAVTSAAEAREFLPKMDFILPTPDQQTPEAFAAFQKAEIEKWSPFIKAAAIRGE